MQTHYHQAMVANESGVSNSLVLEKMFDEFYKEVFMKRLKVLVVSFLLLWLSAPVMADIFSSDLDIFLEKDGVSIQLFSGDQDDTTGDMQLFFDDNSSNFYQGTAPFPFADMQPYESLSSFSGVEATGTWSLSILDDYAPNEFDVLFSWTIFGQLQSGGFFFGQAGPAYNVDTDPATISTLSIGGLTGDVDWLIVGVNIGELDPAVIPIPSGLLLMASGIIGLAAVRRRSNS